MRSPKEKDDLDRKTAWNRILTILLLFWKLLLWSN